MDVRLCKLSGVPVHIERWQTAAADVHVLDAVVVAQGWHVRLGYTALELPRFGSAAASSGRCGAVRLVSPQRCVRGCEPGPIGKVGGGRESPAADRERRVDIRTLCRNLAA